MILTKQVQLASLVLCLTGSLLSLNAQTTQQKNPTQSSASKPCGTQPTCGKNPQQPCPNSPNNATTHCSGASPSPPTPANNTGQASVVIQACCSASSAAGAKKKPVKTAQTPPSSKGIVLIETCVLPATYHALAEDDPSGPRKQEQPAQSKQLEGLTCKPASGSSGKTTAFPFPETDNPLLANLTPPNASQLITNASSVVSNLGSITLQPVSPQILLVFAAKKLSASVVSHLNEILTDFFSPPWGQFSRELRIPHTALFYGSLSTQLQGLGYSQFNLAAVGGDRIRVTSNGLPQTRVWNEFLADIRRLTQSLSAEPPIYKLYYTTAADAAALLPNATNSAPGPPAAPTASTTTTTTAAPMPASPTPPTGPAPTPPTTPPATTTPPTTPTPAAPTPPTSPTPTPPTTPTPPASPAVTAATGTATPTEIDTLTFTESKFGDDAAVTERKRLLAAIDLPRPQMIVNAWVVQNSTHDPHKATAVETLVQGAVREHNEAIEAVLYAGWKYLKTRIASGSYFDPDFYDYLTQRVVFDPRAERTSLFADEANLNPTSASSSASGPPALPANTNRFGICDSHRYCLGYTTLFQPLQPRFTDFLLTLIAADIPVVEMNQAVDAAECTAPLSPDGCLPRPFSSELGLDHEKRLSIARATAKQLGFPPMVYTGPLGRADLEPYQACEKADQFGILYALQGPANAGTPPVPRLFLECFRRAADLLLMSYAEDPNEDRTVPSPVGMLRASVADFLYFYKASQQYPHEFAPYDLSMSADAFDSAMNPLVEAFNRDLNAFEDYLRYWIENSIDQERLVSRKSDFFNGGTITVRSVSGYPSSVQTSSTSFLSASEAPSISNLLSSITGAKPGGGTSAIAPTTTPNVLNNLSFNQAQVLAGALAAFQPQEMQVSRQLNLSFTPRSLIGASSAQLSVTLNADEPAAPAYWPGNSGTSATPADSSYIAQHDTQTTVRVDSIKLFQLSAFTAVLQKGRPLFPLLPPGVTLPYIGTLAGIPLPAAKEYHNSIAVLGAIVVPTASDLAVGLRFVGDRILDDNDKDCAWPFSPRPKINAWPYSRPCTVHRAVSLNDFAGQPIREYNRLMVYCLAHEGRSAEANISDTQAAGENPCSNLTFLDVLHDSN